MMVLLLASSLTFQTIFRLEAPEGGFLTSSVLVGLSCTTAEATLAEKTSNDTERAARRDVVIGPPRLPVYAAGLIGAERGLPQWPLEAVHDPRRDSLLIVRRRSLPHPMAAPPQRWTGCIRRLRCGPQHPHAHVADPFERQEAQ